MGNIIYLNYVQTLELVEAFMKRTYLRYYCTNVCHGDCCGECYTRPTACHQNEGRRLACSMYLCINIQELIFPNAKIRGNYEDICRKVRFALRDARVKTGTRGYENPYHIPYTKEQMEAFRIRKSTFTQLMPTQSVILKIEIAVRALESLVNKAAKSAKKGKTKRK